MPKLTILIIVIIIITVGIGAFFVFQKPVFPDENSFRERFREKIREKWIEKKREELIKEKTDVGLGGIDARIPLKWITENKQEGDGFVYSSGDYGRKLRFGGRERFYEIHVPPGYETSKPTPVVLNFHGGGGYPSAARYHSGMDAVSDKNGFIVVYPAGTGKLFNDRLLLWNTGECCGHAKENNIDDVGFTRAMLDDLENLFNIDTKRIYSTGLSNGSQMSYRLAIELSDRIAAIAPIGATMALKNKEPVRPIPIMHFHGLKDQNAPFQGGIGPRGVTGHIHLSVEENIKFWLSRNGCSTEFAEATMIGKATMTRYGKCRDNTEVILWTLKDGGHTWPGGKMFPSEVKAGQGHINTDISASELMWEFFKKHSMKFEPPIFQYDVDGDEM